MAAWRPILDGELATRARIAVTEIAAALADTRDLGFDLSDGAAGVALFFGYLDDPRADELLDRAVDRIAEAPSSPSLFHGFTGVAWVADHLRMLRGEPLDPASEIDDALVALLESPGATEYGFDLVSGLIGFGVYAAQRRAERCRELVVQRLAELWRETRLRTLPELLPAPTRERWPRGYFDFGLAHGIPGAIAFLAGNQDLPGARALLDELVTWLLARRRSDLATAFPSCEDGDAPVAAARAGWCYGDAAVALALARAGRMDVALALAQEAVARPATGVLDAGLCHGASALAMIFARLHEHTGDATLRAHARDWFARILDYRSAAPALAASAGFYQATHAEPIADRGLLGGAAGIGLALLAATSERAPDWDRALLLG